MFTLQRASTVSRCCEKSGNFPVPPSTEEAAILRSSLRQRNPAVVCRRVRHELVVALEPVLVVHRRRGPEHLEAVARNGVQHVQHRIEGPRVTPKTERRSAWRRPVGVDGDERSRYAALEDVEPEPRRVVGDLTDTA